MGRRYLGPAYVREEAGILVTAAISLVAGATVLGGIVRGSRGVVQKAR